MKLRDVRVFKHHSDLVTGSVGSCYFEARSDGGIAFGGARSCGVDQKRRSKDIARALFRTPVANGPVDQQTLRRALRALRARG